MDRGELVMALLKGFKSIFNTFRKSTGMRLVQNGNIPTEFDV